MLAATTACICHIRKFSCQNLQKLPILLFLGSCGVQHFTSTAGFISWNMLCSMFSALCSMHKTDDLATRGGNLFFILQCGRVPLTVVPQCNRSEGQKNQFYIWHDYALTLFVQNETMANTFFLFEIKLFCFCVQAIFNSWNICCKNKKNIWYIYNAFSFIRAVNQNSAKWHDPAVENKQSMCASQKITINHIIYIFASTVLSIEGWVIKETMS